MGKKTDRSSKDWKNPITGKDPNSYSYVGAGRSLPEPKESRMPTFDKNEHRRLRKAHVEASRPNIETDKPAGISDADYSFLMGAHHMFPNEGARRGNPAINEPHEHDAGVTVQRRAEDLSGPEYRKGVALLAHYGHDARNPLESLRQTQARNLQRVIHEHVMAGVDESASHKFYGGAINSNIPDDEMDHEHSQGVHAATNRFTSSVRGLATHPVFQQATTGMTHAQRMKAATNLMAQATADTSPNAKWRDSTGTWPNLEQADEAAKSALENRPPKFIVGRIGNIDKAHNRVADAVDTGNFATHDFSNPVTSPKTVAFRGALVDREHTDAYKVTDVHEAGAMMPGLSPAKSKMYERTDADGNRVGHKVAVYPDMPKSATKGLTPLYKSEASGYTHPEFGVARAEEVLARGGGTIHALNDHVTREVLHQHGLSRGRDYTDNVHAAQAAVWGSQQMHRADIDVSHADQYPVVRDWGAEGHAELNEAGKQFFGKDFAPTSMSPQFKRNPNTQGQIGSRGSGQKKADPLQGKPYPIL